MDSLAFDRALPWRHYVASMATNTILMERGISDFRLEAPARFAVTEIRFVLAFTEDWCQDSVTAIPPLVAIAECALLDFRVMRRSDELALLQSETGMEFPPIPTFLFYDRSWHEGGRFVEMPRAFKAALEDPAEALWVRAQYDEIWWQYEIEELAAIFEDNRG